MPDSSVQILKTSMVDYMDKKTQILHDKISTFLKEAVPLLRKNIDISLLPTIKKYRIEEDNYHRKKIVQYEDTNWWQIKAPNEVLNLTSYQIAIETCSKYPQIKSHNGKWAYAFNSGFSFSSINVPYQFLLRLIDRENEIKFRRKTFEQIFDDFLKYISTKQKSYARIVVPLDNLNIKSRFIELDHDLRIRKLSSQELVNLINNCHIHGFFYGPGFSSWFKCILEYDLPFTWNWVKEQKQLSGTRIIESTKQSHLLRSNINQEIIILRALLNRPISSPTYTLDYQGWQSTSFSGGTIYYLPWIKSKGRFSDPLSQKSIINYKKYRKRLLNIKDGNTKQQIFVGMRKLAFSMDKPYAGDRLMDAVSGLEGILVDSNTEGMHKFAERVAILLENNKEKRIKLQKDMKKAYEFRSRLAHGSIAADYADTIVTKKTLGQNLREKDIEKSRDIQRLSRVLPRLLHQTLLLCIEKQSSEFDWDSSIMGTKILP